MNVKFSVTKKGYAPSEVDEYIAAVKREYENAIIKQRDRIAKLVEENEALVKELEGYREKSSRISKVIESAVEKAEEIELLSRLKYNQEIERLKAFHDKWTKYYEKILEEYPLDARLKAAGEFNRNMDKILSRIKGTESAATAQAKPKTVDPTGRIERHFESEQKPAKKGTVAKMKEYTDRSPSGFSFEEALNPTEDLESILKDLGVFAED